MAAGEPLNNATTRLGTRVVALFFPVPSLRSEVSCVPTATRSRGLRPQSHPGAVNVVGCEPAAINAVAIT